VKNGLNIQSVAYKNFHSTGNKEIVILLNKENTTLIYGKNGSGKSTFYEALFFGLFGKSFRKSNKPELINNINKKHLLVTVCFSIAGKQYKVIRGLKPNIFEIYRDNTLIDQGSSIKDYQKILEKNILGLSFKAFNQTVILGSLHYVPFMRLPLRDRRDIIEELLDIQIFSQMNICAKQEMSRLNTNYLELDSKLRLADNSIELVDEHILEIKQNSEETKKERNNEIEEKHKELEKCIEKKNTLLKSQVQVSQDQIDSISKSISKWEKYNSLSEKEQKDLIRELNFFEENNSCKTCHQDITDDFKESIKVRLSSRLEKLKEADDKIHIKLSTLKDDLERIQDIKDQMIDIGTKMQIVDNKIDSLREAVVQLEKRNTSSSDKRLKSLKKQLKNFKAKKTRLFEKKTRLAAEQAEFELIIKLLRDDGIKSIIIKKWVPIINKLISKYLSILGFPIKFIFDENFKETIIIKGRKDLSYSSFSAGEKMRVDLALLFAFREVPILRSGHGPNLLIFDEVADSAMEMEGWDSFLSIINSIADKSNVFVISPRGDQLCEKFTKVILFEKKSSFSSIVED
jgi:DNA repair exonuclease SbcCD ATPase subunit